MRILTLEYECNVPGSKAPLKGGTARFARDFSSAVTAQGHIWLGILQRHSSEGAEWECVAREENKEFYSVRSGAMPISEVATHDSLAHVEGAYARELQALRNTLRHLRPDIVFLNGFSQYSWLLYKAAALENVPIAMQHAGLWVRDLEAFAALCPPHYRQLAKEMEREATEGVTANIFLNEYSKEVLMHDLGIETMPGSHIIPLPHAGWAFSGTYGPKNTATRTIAIVARWDRIKNHDAVLAFAEEVHNRKLPWKIIAVTTIPDTPARAAFKSRYRELIEVVPPMDRDSLYAFFQTLDAAILPSRFDTAPGVVMEAAAAGVPTLISPTVGWVSEYAAAGMEDWVADFNEPVKAVDRLDEQFAHDSWPGVRAFAHAIAENHDPAKVFNSYLSLFSRIASQAA